MLATAGLDEARDGARAELLLELVRRTVGLYERYSGILEDAPLPHEKRAQVDAAREQLRVMIRAATELERLSISWWTGGRDRREPSSLHTAPVWSIVAQHFSITANQREPLPRYELFLRGGEPWPYPFDLNQTATALDLAVRLSPEVLRRFLVAFHRASDATLTSLGELVEGPRRDAKKRGRSARNFLLHQLARVFDFVHAVARQRGRRGSELSASTQRVKFIQLVLYQAFKDSLGDTTIKRILGDDLIDIATGTVLSWRVGEPPKPREHDWADILQELRHDPVRRRGILQPAIEAGLGGPWPILDYYPAESAEDVMGKGRPRGGGTTAPDRGGS